MKFGEARSNTNPCTENTEFELNRGLPRAAAVRRPDCHVHAADRRSSDQYLGRGRQRDPNRSSHLFYRASGFDETVVAQMQADLRRHILRAFVGRDLLESCDATEMPARGREIWWCVCEGDGFHVDRRLIKSAILMRLKFLSARVAAPATGSLDMHHGILYPCDTLDGMRKTDPENGLRKNDDLSDTAVEAVGRYVGRDDLCVVRTGFGISAIPRGIEKWKMSGTQPS